MFYKLGLFKSVRNKREVNVAHTNKDIKDMVKQLIRPDIGFSVQHGLGMINIRTGSSRFAAAGESITGVMTNQLFRRYSTPTCTTARFTSDAKKIDFQCAYEKALGALISVISGGNLNVFHGGIHAELTWSPVQEVLDD